jgi:hypothetical protein
LKEYDCDAQEGVAQYELYNTGVERFL